MEYRFWIYGFAVSSRRISHYLNYICHLSDFPLRAESHFPNYNQPENLPCNIVFSPHPDWALNLYFTGDAFPSLRISTWSQFVMRPIITVAMTRYCRVLHGLWCHPWSLSWKSYIQLAWTIIKVKEFRQIGQGVPLWGVDYFELTVMVTLWA